jgi:peptidoglycan glycosyltransferase
MVGVTEGGTATNVAIPGVQVAAKTGTAETGGAAGSNDNWLVAFAPAQHPTIAVAVVVPPQSGLPASPTGSEVAGPIARAMLVAALGGS